MKRKKPYTVITNKDQSKFITGWAKYGNAADIEIKTDNIIWRFKTEDESVKAANFFLKIGFEYVRRPLVKE